jgi:ABC-type Co2+ transport system permease subunit
MTHDVIVLLSALGVAGQVVAVLLLLVGFAWLFGLRGPADLLRRSVEMLYVQALLLGHQPLNAKEMNLLNEGLLALIELGLTNGDEA